MIATQSRPKPRSDDGARPSSPDGGATTGSVVRASEGRIDPGGFGVGVRRIKRARILEIRDPASQGLAARTRTAGRPGFFPLASPKMLSATGREVGLSARGSPVVGEDPLNPVGVGVRAAGQQVRLVGLGAGLGVPELRVG